MSIRRVRDRTLGCGFTVNSNIQGQKTERSRSRKFNPSRSTNVSHIFTHETSKQKSKQSTISPKKLIQSKQLSVQEQSFNLEIVKRKKTHQQQIQSPLKKSNPFKLVAVTSNKHVDLKQIINQEVTVQQIKHNLKSVQEQLTKIQQSILKSFKQHLKQVEQTLRSMFNQISKQYKHKPQSIDTQYLTTVLDTFAQNSQKSLQNLQNNLNKSFKIGVISVKQNDSSISRSQISQIKSPKMDYSSITHSRIPNAMSKSINIENRHKSTRNSSNQMTEFQKFFSAMGKLKNQIRDLNEIRQKKIQ